VRNHQAVVLHVAGCSGEGGPSEENSIMLPETIEPLYWPPCRFFSGSEEMRRSAGSRAPAVLQRMDEGSIRFFSVPMKSFAAATLPRTVLTCRNKSKDLDLQFRRFLRRFAPRVFSES